nr:hypothetical protein [Lachnospiraceae bacterium]
DLSSLIGEMREIYLEYQENEELCNSKLDEMISKDIILPSGNVLIIGQLNFSGNINDHDKLKGMYIEGYILYK